MTALIWTVALVAGLCFFAWQVWGRFGVLLKAAPGRRTRL